MQIHDHHRRMYSICLDTPRPQEFDRLCTEKIRKVDCSHLAAHSFVQIGTNQSQSSQFIGFDY
jgi:hypothetical protein